MDLEKEQRYFEKHKNEFLQKYANQYVLIMGNELVGAFLTPEAAYVAGLDKFGIQPFLVKQVLDKEPVAFAPVITTL